MVYNGCRERKGAETLDWRRELNHSALYQIRVRGYLDNAWSDWFGDMDIKTAGVKGRSATTLTGWVDQSALRGILNRIWDLNLVLISVVPLEASESLKGDT
jgi:hypothetical protein